MKYYDSKEEAEAAIVDHDLYRATPVYRPKNKWKIIKKYVELQRYEQAQK